MKKLLLLVTCLALFTKVFATPNYLEESTEDEASRMAWWKEARFGMFIHWGVYSVLGGTYKGEPISFLGEWIMHKASIPIDEYESYARMFNPRFFDAEEWVGLAADAGVRYIVITSKHHDGFALWDSEVSDWDIMDASPFQRDILAELAEACKKHDIRLCFYHSIMDWHHPKAQAPNYPEYNNKKNRNPEFPEYMESYLKPQLKELLTGYGDIGVLWFDGEWIDDYTEDMSRDLYQYVRELQPDILINNRIAKGRKGMTGLDKEGQFPGDFGTPEQDIPDTGFEGLHWESCMTMNDTWGWKATDSNWKSAQELIHQLIDTVSKGGNYLLNVGPTHEGVIPQPSVERLKAMGTWLDANGEAIYDTTASPFPQPAWGRYTLGDSALYAHVFQWPESGMIYVPALKNRKFTSATLLANGKSIPMEPQSQGVIILPQSPPPQAPAHVIKLKFSN